MVHQLLWSVLDAQHANATLSGPVLRAAAEDLSRGWPSGRSFFMAFDSAGERILGAAMTVAAEPIDVFDYTRPFPDGATCVLVGGFIAGPAGLASAAVAVARAGAQRVEAVILGGSTAPVAGVSQVRLIGQDQARVA